MRCIPFLALLFLAACANPESDAVNRHEKDATGGDGMDQVDTLTGTSSSPGEKSYSNERFRNVKVRKLNDSSWHVSGQGQIFEARFGWVVEDGHNELASGFESTAAGAPAWGDFSFTVVAVMQQPNTTRHLVIYETSAKDGSRQHQLPIPLD